MKTKNKYEWEKHFDATEKQMQKDKEKQHTPTPWKTANFAGLSEKYAGPIDSNGNRVIMTKENSDFIVRAVNSHETNERAIRNTFLRLKRIFEIETEFKPEVRILLAEALMFADEGIQAIAQAEGK